MSLFNWSIHSFCEDACLVTQAQQYVLKFYVESDFFLNDKEILFDAKNIKEIVKFLKRSANG